MENPPQNIRRDIKKVSVKNLEAIAGRRDEEEKYISGQAADLSVEQAIALYLAEKVSNQHTRRAKSKDLEQFATFLRLNNIESLGELGQLSGVRLEKLCFVFLNERLTLKEKVSTVQRKKSSVREFIKYLQRNFNRLITYVPELDHEKFKENRSRGVTESLSFEEWIRLKDQLKAARNKELFPLACFSLLGGGRRISECLELTWEKIDFDNNKINIKPKKKRGGDIEHLPLSDDLKPILEELFLKRSDETIFKSSRQSVDKSFKLYAARAGIKKRVSFHSLRTTFITWGLERGDSLSELLNATLLSSTKMLRFYDRTSAIKTNSIHKTRI